ncbi:DUF177 domain-containing protein [Devosia rhodophyticola]|uniref:DUF177 domain-containing protein n=1 Tax=Devosia rhodophyticola TaxID=3026423 RepID=A0ABY7YXJ4_9HYPH|nr:DUF177 domain-containing protein [Devosia rhodophyticola]WDR06081.1 DUF177 domain-containing protein [Devosia rhodophyticola]
MTQKSEPLFLDAVVRIEKLHPPGRDVTITTANTQLDELATVLKINAVERFDATMVVAPVRGGVHVTGSLNARIEQTSVVSFEPVFQDINEPIDRVFMPGADKAASPAPGSEVFVDLEGDVPDPLDGPELDLTNLLVETIALAIDPYPRQAGESLETLGVELNDEESSPFASLKALKDPPGKQ